MFEVLALCITLSRQPIIGNTSEDGHPFSFDTTIPQVIDCPPQFSVISLIGSADIKATSIRIKEFSTAPEANPAPAKTADKFHQIADEWSSATRYTSSTEDLTLSRTDFFRH